MCSLIVVIAAVTGTLAGPAATGGGFTRWRQAMEAGLRAQAAGAFGDAERHIRASLAMTERDDALEAQRAESLDRLGVLLVARDATAEAAPLLEQALTIRRRVLPPTSLALATSLQNVGSLRDAMGHPTEAEELLLQALALRRRGRTRQERRDLAATHLSLAGVYWKTTRPDEGDRHCRRGLTILDSILGPENVELALVSRNLGRVLLQFGRPQAAAPHLQRAFELRVASVGPHHPTLIAPLQDLATLHSALRDTTSALDCAERAYALSVEFNGPDGPATGQAELKVVDVLRSSGRLDQAKARLAHAIALYQRAYGPSHTTVDGVRRAYADVLGDADLPPGKRPCPPSIVARIRSLKDEGSAALAAQRFDDAERAFRQAVETLDAHDDQRDALFICLYGLGLACKSAGRREEAEPWYRRALSVFERLRDATDPALEDFLHSYVELLEALQRPDDAASVYGRILLIDAERSKEAGHLDAFVARCNDQGERALAAGRRERAGAYLMTAVSIAGQNGLDRSYAVSLRNYAVFLAATATRSTFEPVFRRAAARHEAVFGSRDPQLYELRRLFADALWREGDGAGSLAAERAALAVCPDNPANRLSVIRDWLNRASLALKAHNWSGAQLAASAALETAQQAPEFSAYVPAANILLGRAAYASGDAKAGHTTFASAYAAYVTADGPNSPGAAYTEYRWMQSAAADGGSTAAAALHDELEAMDGTTSPRAADLSGAWPALYETLGYGAGISTLAKSFDQMNGTSDTGPAARRLMARLLLHGLFSGSSDGPSSSSTEPARR